MGVYFGVPLFRETTKDFFLSCLVFFTVFLGTSGFCEKEDSAT